MDIVDIRQVCARGNISPTKFAHLAEVDYRTVVRVIHHLPIRATNAQKIINKAKEILHQQDVQIDVLTYQDPKKKEVRS